MYPKKILEKMDLALILGFKQIQEKYLTLYGF